MKNIILGDINLKTGKPNENELKVIREALKKWTNVNGDTGSLFDDDTATSCMSYYGLCE